LSQAVDMSSSYFSYRAYVNDIRVEQPADCSSNDVLVSFLYMSGTCIETHNNEKSCSTGSNNTIVTGPLTGVSRDLTSDTGAVCNQVFAKGPSSTIKTLGQASGEAFEPHLKRSSLSAFPAPGEPSCQPRHHCPPFSPSSFFSFFFFFFRTAHSYHPIYSHRLPTGQFDSSSSTCSVSRIGYFFIQNNCKASSGKVSLTLEVKITAYINETCTAVGSVEWWIGVIIVGVFAVFFVGLFAYCCMRRRRTANIGLTQVQMGPVPMPYPPPGSQPMPYPPAGGQPYPPAGAWGQQQQQPYGGSHPPPAAGYPTADYGNSYGPPPGYPGAAYPGSGATTVSNNIPSNAGPKF
jgi:hypothetical protein